MPSLPSYPQRTQNIENKNKNGNNDKMPPFLPFRRPSSSSWTDIFSGHALNGFYKFLSIITACQLSVRPDYHIDASKSMNPNHQRRKFDDYNTSFDSVGEKKCIDESQGDLKLNESGTYVPQLKNLTVFQASQAMVKAALINVAAMGIGNGEPDTEMLKTLMQNLVEVCYSELAEAEFAEMTTIFMQRGLLLSSSRDTEEPGVMRKVWKAFKFLEEPLLKMTKRHHFTSLFIEAGAIIIKAGLFLEVLRKMKLENQFLECVPLQLFLLKYENDLIRIMETMYKGDILASLNVKRKSPTSRPFYIPFLQNSSFRGRETILGDMFRVLHGRNEIIQSPTYLQLSFNTTKQEEVICLLGEEGVGKTELAVEYAYRHMAHYDGLLWVDAHPSCVEENIAALAGVLDIEVDQAEDVKVQMHQVMEALESNEQFLLILDNVHEEKTVEMLRIKKGGTRIVVTSHLKLKDLPKHTLDCLPLEKAKEVLSGSRLFCKADKALMGEIAVELERLPLALSTASRLLETGLSPSELLICLHKGVMELFGHTRIDRTFQKSSILQGLFSESMQQLKRGTRPETSLAEAIFQVGGFFGPHPIPGRILTIAAKIFRNQPISGETMEYYAAIDLLSSLNFIRQTEGRGHSVLFHSVLQAFSRSQDREGKGAKAVVKALAGAFCSDNLVCHFTAIWERFQEDLGTELGVQEDVMAVLLSLVQYKLGRQKVGEARKIIKKILEKGGDLNDAKLDFWYLNVEGPLGLFVGDERKGVSEREVMGAGESGDNKETPRGREREKERIGEEMEPVQGEVLGGGKESGLVQAIVFKKRDGEGEGLLENGSNFEREKSYRGESDDEEDEGARMLLDKLQFLQQVDYSERKNKPFGLSVRCRQFYHKASTDVSALIENRVEWESLRQEVEMMAETVKPRNLVGPYGIYCGINWEDVYILDSFVDLSLAVVISDQFQDNLLQICRRALVLAEQIFPARHFRIRAALWNVALSFIRLTHLSHQQQTLRNIFWWDPKKKEVEDMITKEESLFFGSKFQEQRVYPQKIQDQLVGISTAFGDFHFQSEEREEAVEALKKLLLLEGSSSFLRAYVEGLLVLTDSYSTNVSRTRLTNAKELLERVLGVSGEVEGEEEDFPGSENWLNVSQGGSNGGLNGVNGLNGGSNGLSVWAKVSDRVRWERSRSLARLEMSWRKGESHAHVTDYGKRVGGLEGGGGPGFCDVKRLDRLSTWGSRDRVDRKQYIINQDVNRRAESLDNFQFTGTCETEKEIGAMRTSGGEELKCRMETFKGRLGRSMLLPGVGGLMEDRNSKKRRGNDRVFPNTPARVRQARPKLESEEQNFYFTLQNDALHILGMIYERLGKLTGAEKLLEIASVNAVKGDSLKLVPQRLIPLALVQIKRGQLREAHKNVWRSLAMYEASGKSRNVSVGQALSLQAAIHWLSGSSKGAKRDLGSAIQLLEKELGKNHLLVGDLIAFLGRLHMAEGNLGEALSLQQRSLLIHGTVLGGTCPGLSLCLEDLAETEKALGNREASNELRRRAIALIGQNRDPELTALKEKLESQREYIRDEE